jgi:class 3 adenylate cyclase/ubiquinone/menaquinone biosynthesis C-methylase UbiE
LARATTATILFTDLVGSTALSARLGATRAEQLFNDHFELVGRTVDEHGGDVVKTLGDGVMACFGAVTDAVECAVTLQQAVDSNSRGQPDGLALRIGMSVGEVTLAQGDYFGTPVVEAARLCAEARARQVLASGLIRQLAGSRCAHAFRTVGPVDLKGLPEPLHVDEVAWAPLVERGLAADFAHIDDDEEPDRFVAALNRMRQAPFLTQVRDRILELLVPLPGERLLDVGSGVGEDALELSPLVGERGFVVGVDNSETMVVEADRRARAAAVENVEFRCADAQALPFDDDAFDGARSDRTFQYLSDPLRAVRELARVTRPGGRIVVSDTDWETAVFDHDDIELTARINRAWTDTRASGRIGHQLHGLFLRAGLLDVTVAAHTNVVTTIDDLYETIIDSLASQAVAATAVTESEASRWKASIEAADREGRFFRALTMFVVYGRVP